MSLAIYVLPPALLALALLALDAARRPILARMGLRNLQRRRTQALAISLGLMVGTALISGALATGDSMTAAIRGASIEAFGPLDESVGMDGRLYFPERVADELERDDALMQVSDGLAPLLIEDVAVAHARERQAEPRAALVGIDPARDARFGPYRTAQGDHSSAELRPGEVIINERLAASLRAEPGDQVTVRFAPRPDPLLPRLFVFNGTLTASAGAPLPLPIPGLPPPYAQPPTEGSFEVPVEAGAQRITAVLLWGSPNNATDLDVLLQSPDGAIEANPNGTLGQPDAPAVVNATAQPGTWLARVASKAAAAQRFTLVVLVFYPVTDLAQVEAFLDELEQRPEAQGFLQGLAGNLRIEARNFTVAFVASEPGRGGFLNAPDVFVRLDEAQAMFGKQGRANLLMVSNPGDAEQGLQGTDRAMAALEPALDAIKARAAPEEGLEGLRARPLKQEFVQEAERTGGIFTSFLTTMSSFSILAGLILIANVFVMLTEERRTELGMARALGMTRRDVTRLFLYEGGAYAIVASVLGAFAGLLISLGLITALNLTLGDQLLIEIPFRPSSDALLVSFGAGVLMTLGAVLVASQRAARLNIVRSIRRLEEPDTPLGRSATLAGAAMVALGVPLSLWALWANSFTAMVLAPNLVILGLALLGARIAHRSTATRLAGAAMFLFNLGTIYAAETPASLEGTVMGPVRGVLIVLGAVLVLVHARRLLEGSASLLARIPSLRPIARTALAYPLHKRLRTGLTMLMFGLVLTVVVLFSVFFAIFTPSLGEQGGGYDVRADSTLPVQDLEQRLRDAARQEPVLRGVRDVASLEYAEVVGGRLITVNGERVRYQGPPVDYVYGFDGDFAASQRFPLIELDPRFPTAEAAYRAVLDDASLVIVSRAYTNGPDGRPGTHGVGDTLTMRTRAGQLNLTIIAVQKQLYFGGIFVGKPMVEANFEALHGLHLAHVAPGSDSVAIAAAIEATQQDLGVDAASIAEEAGRFLQAQRQLYALFEVYLGLGLVLGIASLGIITARSVLERRQEVGMLRAIGLPRAMVFRSFVLEGLFIVTIGAVVGVSIGLLVAYGVHLKSLAVLGLAFVIPWGDIAIILAVAYLATLLAVLGPARRAAALQPAEAIRYIE